MIRTALGAGAKELDSTSTLARRAGHSVENYHFLAVNRMVRAPPRAGL